MAKIIFPELEGRVLFFKKYQAHLLFFIILVAFVFTRFSDLSGHAVLGWDQADSAWAAKGILYDNPLTLQGVPIKGNAGMFMGPLYYYLITPFYYFSKLDMIASPIFAGVVSVVSFLIFFYITKKLFNVRIAFVASLFYTFGLGTMTSDRIQAAYVLVPIVSYVVFYNLYKCITESEKHILFLAAAIGFGFHVHFTTIFYLPIVLLTLPFFPRTKKAIVYTFLAIPIFLLFISPILYSVLTSHNSASNGVFAYVQSSYHGLHARRVIQLAHDAFISVEGIYQFKILRPFVFLVSPLFAYIYYFRKPNKKRFLFIYLMVLWILVPWFALSTYTGELTEYYFSLPRNINIAMIAYLLFSLYEKRYTAAKIFVLLLLSFYVANNMIVFPKILPGNYRGLKQTAKQAVADNIPIEFKNRDPLSYMYYVYANYR
jgi:4-amino-4-deoxy-L-arabinose transferase-like glycosyltransferase